MDAIHGQAGETIDAARIKAKAIELGAELVGIADADTLNAFPPDPNWPQTPERISEHAKRAVVLAIHIPSGTFRARAGSVVRHMDNLAIRRIERLGQALARWLEREGYPAFPVISNETDWTLKGGTYGYLSMRHLAVEAGLGTLGLNVNLVTPEYGSRVYLAAVLTEAEVEADKPLAEQVCIGEGCSRCLYGCPPDAVEHFGINKRACSTHAQVFGFAQLTAYAAGAVRGQSAAGDPYRTPNTIGFWQTMTRVAGAFGACPRCHAVCPIGQDYEAYLLEPHREIPENTPEKVDKGRAFQLARKAGEEVAGLNEWNLRWVGPEGYSGRAVRELHRRRRAARAADAKDPE